MIPIALLRVFGLVQGLLRRRLTLSAGVLVFGLVAAVVGGAHLASRHGSRGLAPALATRLASHATATAAETVAVAAAKREARSDSTTAAGALTRARPGEVAVKHVAEQADSLARSADWEPAYRARTSEVTELLAVDALKDTALVAAEHRGAALDSALQLTEVRAARSDTLLNDVARAATADGCSWACHARRIAAVAVVVAGAVAARNLVRK